MAEKPHHTDHNIGNQYEKREAIYFKCHFSIDLLMRAIGTHVCAIVGPVVESTTIALTFNVKTNTMFSGVPTSNTKPYGSFYMVRT